MKTIVKRALWLALISVIGVGVFLMIRRCSEPSGFVASYSIFPHDSNDVLNFSEGKVTLETCCGDQNFGTYSRSNDGTWIWQYQIGSKRRLTKSMVIEPGVYSMTFTDVSDPSDTFTLRRRAFKNFPL